MAELRVDLASTFTCDLAARPTAYWLSELGISHQLELAPYNQLFQHLAQPGAPGLTEPRLQVLLIRLEDWCGAPGNPQSERLESLRRNVEELIGLLSTSQTDRGHVLVCLCPPSPAAQAELGAQLAAVEGRISGALLRGERVDVVESRSLLDCYPVPHYYEPLGDAEGHLPYTAEFFTAVGTLIARKAYALAVGPHKLLALDCDGTLWSGVCAEDGPAGVSLEPGHLALQRRAVAQREAGMLLALCSKNVPGDVWAVLEGRNEQLLRREHLAGWRIDWSPKSVGLRSLAGELQLGLDRVLFLDDNPLECAEVERGCPEALVLQLPARAEEIPGFLDHVWALDRAGTTREDRLRATHYQQNSAREVALQSAGSLAEFIERLELRVRIAPPSPEELERVAQLSQRVTQFNTQPATRTAGEIEGWIRAAGQGCRVVHVADRFGDYGLVGAVLFREEPAALVVESLLLSCRALGRGVEHRVLAHLGAQAAASGKAEVRFPTTVTARNRPALDFLHSVSQPDAAGTFVVSTVDAAEVEYRPGTEPAQPAVPASAPAPVEPRSNRAAALARLARLGGDVAALHAEVERSRLRSRVQLPGDPVPARSPLEVSLAEIAAAVLGFDHVGVRDNLFELGAHSLLLVQISSRIRDALGVTVPFTHWFQDPTVAGIAARLEAEAPAVDTAADRQAALLAQLEEMSDEEAERLLLELEGDALPASPAPAWTPSPAPSATPRSQAREAGAEPGIEIVAVLTRGRPDLVGRCLESVIENTSRHGRQPRLMVFDDTPAGAGSDLRACAGALASRHANSIGVFGTREARQLGEELVRTSGVSEDVVQFALHGDSVSDYSLGGNRNHMLLRTAGHAVYCTDNDVIVQPTPHPERRAGCGFSFGEDPGDYWFFPDADTEEQATPPSPDDFLAAHERLLGRRAADVLTSLAGYPGDPQSHRIALTSNGFVGDCGWGSPFGFWHAPMGYLLLEGASHARLVNSEADYRTACTSRRLLRVVPQDLVTDATFSMGGLMAFDNRHLLAPVFPSARGQDVVFGTVMWECFPDAVLGQVAQALRHTPIQPRRFWPGEMTRSASGMDLARFVIECIRVTGFSRAEAQPGRGLGQLGERLRDLAALPAAEFQHTVLRQARRSNEGWIALMEARLREADSSAPYWKADVRRYIDLLAEASRSSTYWQPLDLARGESPEVVGEHAQRLIARFAELLVWWPTLAGAAAALGARGEGVLSA